MFLACLLKNITFWAIVIETVYSGSEIPETREKPKKSYNMIKILNYMIYIVTYIKMDKAFLERNTI